MHTKIIKQNKKKMLSPKMASNKTTILILKHVDLLKIFQVNSYFIKSRRKQVFQVSMTMIYLLSNILIMFQI